MLAIIGSPAPPAEQAAIDALEAALARPGPRPVIRRSVERGRAVADAVFEWSRTDGGHEGDLSNFPPDYIPPSGPGLWEPTPPGFQRALLPYWGANRPLAVTSADIGHPGPPPPYSTDPASSFYAEGLEVYDTVNQLADEQRAIALFWSDEPGVTATPPGHSVSILNQVLVGHDARLSVAAEAYARLGIAVADAFVCCWQVKYEYNVLRPITYIQSRHRRWVRSADAVGHAAIPGVHVWSLRPVGGDGQGTHRPVRYAGVHRPHPRRPGSPGPHFTSFEQAAAEAAISRLYGGIHYRSAIDRGLPQGHAIGRAVTHLPLRRAQPHRSDEDP